MRRILYVTGTRADFGLMESTLQRIAREPGLSIELAVTGMHLSADYGMTVRDVEASGLPIVARVPTNVHGRDGASMAQSLGQAVIGLTAAMQASRPDMLMVIGDRGEMLAAAIAALHLGIPIVHLHGGERSGTVDEPVRHAISKLSHWHFVATEESRERVVRLGERPDHVWVTGAPSLDDVAQHAATPRDTVTQALGLPAGARYVMVLFHPVVQEMHDARDQTESLAAALQDAIDEDVHVVWLAPNADAGSGEILAALERAQGPRLHRLTHLPRPMFVAALAHALALVGNSSAGIIESASVGVPVVNVGNRQRARERNANTTDCDATRDAIAAALRGALAHGPYARGNRYGDGHAGERIVRLLATQPIDAALLDKINTY